MSRRQGSPKDVNKHQRRSLVVGLLAIASLFAVPERASAQGSTIYVDQANPACTDAGTGTQLAPFCTIVKAGQKALAGQTVEVASGTYSGQVQTVKSGAAGSPITYRPAPGASVTVTGGPRGFYISKVSYIVVTGFLVTGTSSNGLYVVNSSNISLVGNNVQYSGQPTPDLKMRGVYVSGSTDIEISGNQIHHNSDSGIYLTGGSTRVVVSANDIYQNARGYLRAAAGIEVRSPGNTIVGNSLHDNEDSGISIYPGGDNTLVVNNVVYRNKGVSPTIGVTGDHGVDNLGVSGSRVVGNTVFNNTTAGINVEGASAGALIKNNLSVDNGINSPRTTSNIRVDSTSTVGTVLDHDLVSLSAGTYNVIFGTGWYPSIAALNAATGQEAHGLQADPQWVNPSGDDFHLLATSPAIDSADSGASGAAAADREGSPRVDLAAVANTGMGPRAFDDRGAYERQ